MSGMAGTPGIRLPHVRVLSLDVVYFGGVGVFSVGA
jgi:hypothetical protein